jgi:hypothetical protein
MRRILLLLTAALCLPSCMRAAPPTPPAAASPLACHLEAVPPSTVRFTLTNRSQAPVRVLRWNTPLEERWRGTIFRVTSGGKEIPYQGPLTKRGDPGPEEYVEIAPGGSVSGDADLSAVYDLAPGSYRVEVAEGLADVAVDAATPRPRDQHRPLALECGELAITLQ